MGAAGLFYVATHLGGASTATANETKPATVNVYNTKIENHIYMEIPNQMYTLANNPKIMREMAKVLLPLKRPGIDGFYINSINDNATTNDESFDYRITPQDLDSLNSRIDELDVSKNLHSLTSTHSIQKVTDATVSNELIPERTPNSLKHTSTEQIALKILNGVYTIESAPLGNFAGIWQLRKEERIGAIITDYNFIEQLRSREIILGEHDSIEVELQQSHTNTGIHYEVTKVIKYIPGGLLSLSR